MSVVDPTGRQQQRYRRVLANASTLHALVTEVNGWALQILARALVHVVARLCHVERHCPVARGGQEVADSWGLDEGPQTPHVIVGVGGLAVVLTQMLRPRGDEEVLDEVLRVRQV